MWSKSKAKPTPKSSSCTYTKYRPTYFMQLLENSRYVCPIRHIKSAATYRKKRDVGMSKIG